MSARLLVVTGSRAEYGLLRPLLDAIARDGSMEASLLVTGAHLSPAHGLTVTEIETDGRAIAARVPLPLDDDSEAGVARAFAAAVSGSADALAADRPDLLVALGDRYETFAAAAAAHLARVPIAHLHGGELTEGATDDGQRHALTKLATLHFTSAEEYRRRVIQMGEDPARVHTVGAFGLDNVRLVPMRPEAEVREALGLPDGRRYVVVTFHPVTLDDDAGLAELRALLGALDDSPDLAVVLTRPNADAGNRSVHAVEDEWLARNTGRAVARDSLGVGLYLNAARHAVAVVGNSSSGIIEAPALGTPSIDIGTRQSGRARAASVRSVKGSRGEISAALHDAVGAPTPDADFESPYGDGHASERTVSHLREWFEGPRDAMKRFYDVKTDLTSAP